MSEGYYEIAITTTMIERTLDRCERSGGEFNNSYHRDKGKSWGYLGEEVVLACLGDNAELVDNKDFDILFKGRKIDVKTKTRKDAPRPDFDAMILADSMHQRVDWYFFVSMIAPQNLKDESKENILKIMKTLERAYVVGCIEKEAFFTMATLNKSGERSNNFLWRADAYTLPYSKLLKYEPQKTGIKLT